MQPSLLYEFLSIPPNVRACIVDEHRALTYGEVDRETSELAVLLVEKHGIAKGDRVAILLPNCWQYVIALYAIFKTGAIAVPIDFRSSQREVKFFLENSGSNLVIIDDTKLDFLSASKLERIVVDSQSSSPVSRNSIPSQIENGIMPSDSICILYTGGTTGTPKGVVLTHQNFTSLLSGISKAWQLRSGREVFAQFLPMTHSGGLNCNINSALASGGKTVIMRKFDASRLLDIVEKHNVTAFAGVPTIFNGLAKSSDLESRNLSSLRLCFSSGASLSEETQELFKTKTGVVINVGWGLTEASPQLTIAPLGVFKPNYVGIPLPETQIIAVDDVLNPLAAGEIGQLAAKGPQVMKGYWRNEEETRNVFTPTGFLLTGDIGYVSSDGVYLLGRKKNVVNSGGYKIWPHEVESVLLENDHVLEAAVIGVTDQYLGETVKAFVVLKSETSEEELKEFCKLRLSSYKVPRLFEFRDSLPKSSVGKILHRVLREEGENRKIKQANR